MRVVRTSSTIVISASLIAFAPPALASYLKTSKSATFEFQIHSELDPNDEDDKKTAKTSRAIIKTHAERVGAILPELEISYSEIDDRLAVLER